MRSGAFFRPGFFRGSGLITLDSGVLGMGVGVTGVIAPPRGWGPARKGPAAYRRSRSNPLALVRSLAKGVEREAGGFDADGKGRLAAPLTRLARPPYERPSRPSARASRP